MSASAAALALALVMLAGCGTSGDAAPSCVTGEVVRCACGGGEEGAALCLDDGTTTTCACAGAAIHGTSRGCEAPGTLRPCLCEDGRAGEQACRADGTLATCVCEAAPTRDESTTDDADGSQAPPDTTPPPTPASERCCHELGTCLARELIPSAERERFGRDSCSDVELACVPDAFVQADALRLQPCRSHGLAEGRCLPDCLPETAAQRELLPRDLCAQHELCVPCFDPRSGVPSGVCELGADPGPTEAAVVFGRCCDEQGQCVPEALLPAEADASALPIDTCDDARALVCVPDALTDGLASCRALGLAEGRCMPSCLLSEAQAEQLAQASCDDAQRCVPCFDPLSGAASGACELGDDSPSEAPFVFGDCCVSEGTPLGRCLPSALVPATGTELQPLECSGEGEVCVPSSLLAAPGATLPTCRGRLGGDGRCLPACMIDENLAPLLIEDVCTPGALCVPCEILGQPTGVCAAP